MGTEPEMRIERNFSKRISDQRLMLVVMLLDEAIGHLEIASTPYNGLDEHYRLLHKILEGEQVDDPDSADYFSSLRRDAHIHCLSQPDDLRPLYYEEE